MQKIFVGKIKADTYKSKGNVEKTLLIVRIFHHLGSERTGGRYLSKNGALMRGKNLASLDLKSGSLTCEKGKPATQLEVLEHTHVKKGKDKRVKEYANDKAKRGVSIVREKFGDICPDFDADSWVAATGGQKGGRLYGFGNRQDLGIILGTTSHVSSSSAPTPSMDEAQAEAFVGAATFKRLMGQALHTMFTGLGIASLPPPNGSNSVTHLIYIICGSEIEHEAFLATWLSTFVFPISGVMRKDVFPFAIQLARGNPIALAPAVLATIYRDLDLLKEAIVASTKKFQTGGDENDSLELVLWSPFYLVQIWAWERIQALQPKPNTIKIDDPILARWHKVRNLKVHNTRLALNTAGESFLWRPYAILVRKCSFPNIYSEKEVWVPVDPNLNKELLSFAECLRVSELFGLDCRTWYHPHRVAMQFGIDQDIPGCVGEWPINEGKLYIPARFFESDVTTRYLEWYRQSVLVPLDPIKDLKRKKRSPRKSNLAAEASNAKGDNDTNILSPCFPIKSKMKFLHEILEVTKGDNNADVPSGFHPKPNSNNVKDVSESMKGYDMLDVPPGFPAKHNTVNSGNSAEECEPTLMELNRSAESAYSVDVSKATRGDDTVDVPSAVHPKHSTVDSGNSVEEGLPAIVELTCSAYMNDSNRTLKSSINSIEEVSEVIKEDKTADVSTGFPRIHDTVNSGKSVEQGMSTIMEMTGAADMDENLGNRTTHDHDAMCLSGQPARNSSPSIEDGSAKKMDQLMNSVVKTESEDYLGGLEETMEDVGDRKVASPVDDKVSIHSTEGKRSRMTSDEMSLDSVQEFEERISKLERVVADLTAAPIRQSCKNETTKHG
ncbi:putative Serine/threonine protein phosphatase 7 long form [Quillaja saponaria]|uniref:Serine/threonine protein phosphatase 7 long form n=1 Tax=Quillaja saponaria TaxID=32244 RepID=A0AAD7PN34_QUISA|nr:putative Serine/threonine protein phosphatase 7 long form [Quillaja saponaria]